MEQISRTIAMRFRQRLDLRAKALFRMQHFIANLQQFPDRLVQTIPGAIIFQSSRLHKVLPSVASWKQQLYRPAIFNHALKKTSHSLKTVSKLSDYRSFQSRLILALATKNLPASVDCKELPTD
ncbi:MAG TPA: hypothetical protein VLM90_13570, partial [Candidatus Deferrimicrobium sp.]|nr:hypothetical protein [Candidatus Deferrimicrobium sp.]